MIATLRFRIPEEQSEFDLAYRGGEWSAAMEELATWLRNETHYAEDSPRREALEEVRKQLFEIINGRDLHW
jgi:hypothetical protein